MVASAQQRAAGAAVRVQVVYFRQTEETVLLREVLVPVDDTERSRAVTVDIVPCLRDPLRVFVDQGGAARLAGASSLAQPATAAAARAAVPDAARCDVLVELTLIVDGDEVDRTGIGPLSLSPGARAEVEAPPLFAGLNQPGLEARQSPTAVDLQLIRMVLAASDQDRNLSALQLRFTDPGQSRFEFVQLTDPRAELTDTLYWFITLSSSNLGTVRLDAFDTKGADSTLTLAVRFPASTAPTATQADAIVGSAGSTTVSFTLFDRESDADTVEVLFRDPSSTPQGAPVLNGLAGPVCVRSVQPGTANGVRRQVSCPTPGQPFAQVVVIPFDRTGPGQAARGPVAIP